MVFFSRLDEVLASFREWDWEAYGSINDTLRLVKLPIYSQLSSNFTVENRGNGFYSICGRINTPEGVLREFATVTKKNRVVTVLGDMVAGITEAYFGETNHEPYKTACEKFEVI